MSSLFQANHLIRNLLLGRQIVRSLGGQPSNAGFMCDLFGQNSQMPQIFAGFGISGAFIWRGLNESQHMIRWKGADGTEIPVYKFGKYGYCDYAIQVRHSDHPEHPFDFEERTDELVAYLDKEASLNDVNPILMFDGGDHMQWDQDAYRVLTALKGQTNLAYDIRHTSLDTYVKEMTAQADQIKTTATGELRAPGIYPLDEDQQWVIPGVLSSRVWIKQANAACQTLLCQWAEPLSVMAQAYLGKCYPQGYLDVAWKWLLNNHPHDSICGCSIDAVHEDMRYRFHQCQEISTRLIAEATHELATHVAGEPGDGELKVVVFNALPVEFNQPAEITLEIPAEWPTFNEFFGYEPKPAFKVFDSSGKEIAYQRLGQTMNQTRIRSYPSRFTQSYKVNLVKVSLPVSIPPVGYETLTVKAGKTAVPTRYPEVPGMATSERSMANGLLSVTIESNGTLTIVDLRNGQTYERGLTFEDRADIGDGWFHGIATNDQIFLSSASPAAIALVNNGPQLTTFRIRSTMTIPAEFDYPTMQRSTRMVELVIDSLVSLRSGSDRVEIETIVHNNAGDHRLRVLFPTGAQADTFLTDTPFDVVERTIALSTKNHLYRELEVETRPQQTWSAVFQKPRGLAMVSKGLMEVAVKDLPERPLALTLYRSTRRTVFTEGEPLGQLFGDLTFNYWIIPLTDEPDRTRLSLEGQILAAGIRVVQLSKSEPMEDKITTRLPSSSSFINVQGSGHRDQPAGGGTGPGSPHVQSR